MNIVHKKIHEHLKKNVPKSTHKARKLFCFKYPKLFFLTLSIVLAYFIFKNPLVSSWISHLGHLNYLGIFLAGIFLAFGFSAPFSVGFFIMAQPGNIFLASLIGGVGAVFADLTIFKIIRFSFRDEFNLLKKTEIVHKIKKIVSDNPHVLIKHYLLYIFAGIFIAFPLPDEVGISMLAGLTTIKQGVLAFISFILHTSFIFLILYASI